MDVQDGFQQTTHLKACKFQENIISSINLQTKVLGKVEAMGGAVSLETKSIRDDECIWGKH